MKKSLIGLIAFLLFLGLSTGAMAETINSRWAKTAPTIDGVLGFDEWAGAQKTDVTGTLNYTFYVMNDDEYLYVAWEVTGDAVLNVNDNVGYYFDNDHDKAWPADCAEEGNYWLYDSLTGTSLFRPWQSSGPCTSENATDVFTVASVASGHMVFESRALLAAPEMTAAPGSTIGFFVYAQDNDAMVISYWPSSSSYLNPTTYADLTLATAPEEMNVGFTNLPPVIDGEMDEEEWAEATEMVLTDGAHTYNMYFMSDGVYLYGATDALSDTTLAASDGIGLYFDNDLSGNWPASCADEGNNFMYYYPAGFDNSFRPFYWTGSTWAAGPMVADDTITAAASLAADSNVQMEYRINLTESQMVGGFDETIGFFFFYTDDNAEDSLLLFWPEEATWSAPYTYGLMNYPTRQTPSFAPHWTDTPPTIDGTFDAGEWDDATMIPVYEETGVNVEKFNTYTQSDGDYLYIAFDLIDDSAFGGLDKIVLFFDNEHDGAWGSTCAESTEGRYLITNDGADLTLEFQPAGSDGSPWCTAVTTTTFEAAQGMSADANVRYEIKIDLDGGQLAGAMGETIGFRYFYYDATSASQGRWPMGTDNALPADFAALTFPSCDGCWADGACRPDGTINPENECQWCDVSTSTTGWTDLDGIACTDDGLFCTGDEVCVSGSCESEGDPCEEFEICNETTDVCDPAADDDTTDDDTTDDDTTDDDTTDDDTTDDDTIDDDTTDDDTTDDDTTDDDTTDDDTADDDTDDDDTDDDDIDDDVDDDDATPDDDDTTQPSDDDDDDDSGCGC